jgi:nicotinate-nucleotide pyrophosphorylase (carboxylating)
MKKTALAWIDQEVALALAEDIGSGDLSAHLIPETQMAVAQILCRESAIMCGQAWLESVFRQLDPDIIVEWFVSEGQSIAANALLCRLTGKARPLLTGERTALNFLQTLMGTATVTAQYVQALADSHTRLLDTRKTLPLLRQSQKYAVNIGGGVNHRIGLYDAILIKENHIIAAGSIEKAVLQAKTLFPNTFVEVEVETLAELERALTLPIDRIMLDNFTLADIATAVTLTQGKIPLEVSGNVSLEQLDNLSKTKVDFISTGAITKHLRAIDLSMRFQMETHHS